MTSQQSTIKEALLPFTDIANPATAAQLDASHPSKTRDLYELPTRRALGAQGGDLDAPAVYMAGNSLGLLPKKARQLISEEMDVWGTIAVMGHFAHPHGRSWKDIDAHVVAPLAELVGAASPSEVACTSTLTSNLHNLFVTFFRPEGKRRKILVEGKAFPSDQYAVQSHLDLHGLGKEALIELEPREGELNLRTEDILAVIEEQGDEIALVWLSGVQFYTGQFFQISAITKAAKAKGCTVGFDLAHAAGNVPLKLHDWGVDFAVWCHYKYLNSGPGAVAGLFVHSTHDAAKLPRLSGWWGHDHSTRFAMPPTFQPIPGAQGFQHSNPPLLSMIPLIASLETVSHAGGIHALRERSFLLTGYLIALLGESKHEKKAFTVITPESEEEHGCQLSLKIEGGEKVMMRVFEGLVRRGVMGDERKPEVIRLSPIPLYSTFEDVRVVALALEEALDDEAAGRAEGAKGIEMVETS